MKLYMVELRFLIDKHYIGYLKSIVEAYDNLAVLSTVDSDIGIISLSVTVNYEFLIRDIIESLPDKILIKFLDKKVSS